MMAEHTLAERIAERDRLSGIRARQRLTEADAILDRRIIISRRAFDRDNLRALKFCKAVLWIVVTCALLYSIIWFIFAV